MEIVYKEENNMSYFNIYFTLEMLLDLSEYYSIVFQIKKKNNKQQFPIPCIIILYIMREPKPVIRNKDLTA